MMGGVRMVLADPQEVVVRLWAITELYVVDGSGTSCRAVVSMGEKGARGVR